MPPSRPPPSRAVSYESGWPGQDYKAQPTSRAVSCEHCRRRKMKCSRTFPCSSCEMRGETCVWPAGAVPPPSGDTELSAAHDEVRRLRRLCDMLMGRLAELQQATAGSSPPSELDFGYPSMDRDFIEREYQPSHPHMHLHRSSTFPPPAPSSSSGASIISYDSSYSTSRHSYSHNSHYDYRSTPAAEEGPLFPGFPGGLPFAPPGVGGGAAAPHSHFIAPVTTQQTASQPGDIFVGDGSDFLVQQRFY